MFNPIPSVFGTEYDDGFKENRAWADDSFKRHVETVNALTYVPLLISVASSVSGINLVDEASKFLKRSF